MMLTRTFASRWSLLLIAALLTSLIATTQWQRTAQASGIWYVSPKGADSNDCLSPATACRTIGDAIGKAAPGDTINLAAGTYAETLIIPADLSIKGAGARSTIIDGGSRAGVLAVNDPAARVSIGDVTISGGRSVGSGGGITNYGTLRLSNSTVLSNTVTLGEGFQGLGGGVANFGTLTLSGTAVISNTGFTGGGIYNSGVLTATNSTISGNTARNDGGGLANGRAGLVSLNNVTIANNATLTDEDELGGGGISNELSGTVRLRNTLIGRNLDTEGQAPDCRGRFDSDGHNLLQATAGCTIEGDPGADILGQDPLLGPLQDNGGPTLTHALLANSPAIDAGDTANCPATDQRGVPRPQARACDIGAYEAVFRCRLFLPLIEQARACSCSIWGDAALPAIDSDPDPNPVELGLKFRSTVDGVVAGVRFYKGPLNIGTHTGSLWTSSGTLLASATFTDETPLGWQTVMFTAPVSITANTTYVVSYYTSVGHYAADEGYFAASGVASGPLQALKDGEAGGNGVYMYGESGFPDQTYHSTNYWVDVVFETAEEALK